MDLPCLVEGLGTLLATFCVQLRGVLPVFASKMATSGGGLTLLPTMATARLLLTCRPSCVRSMM